MAIQADDATLKLFVRDVLGCGCPDEVFNKIEASDIDLGNKVKTATRVVIGDTLLIYILPDISIENVSKNIQKLVAAGKQDRDSHSYNRFRLIVRSSNNKDMEESIRMMFAEASIGDEKLHLHFVGADELMYLKLI